MVLELMTGGELFEKIAMDGPLSEGAGRRVFQQLLDGLAYCHAQGVYHRRAHGPVKGSGGPQAHVIPPFILLLR